MTVVEAKQEAIRNWKSTTKPRGALDNEWYRQVKGSILERHLRYAMAHDRIAKRHSKTYGP